WQHDRAIAQTLLSMEIEACVSDTKSKAEECYSMPSTEEAEATILESIATLRDLTKFDPSNLSWQSDLASALQVRAKVLASRGRNAERLASLQESEEIYRRLELEGAYAERLERVAFVLQDKAETLLALGSSKEANETMQDAVERITKLVTAHKDMRSYVSDLSNAHLLQAKILRETGDETGAKVADGKKEQLDKEYDTLTERWQQRGGELIEQSVAKYNDGQKLYEAGNYDAALREFKAAEAAAREYGHVWPSDWQAYDWLSSIYRWIGETQKKLPNAMERASEQIAALRASMHAARIATMLAPEAKEKEMTEKLVLARQTLGQFLYA